MAALLTQLQTIKESCERVVVAIEDVNDLWPVVKEGFEARVPFRKACLNNKARNPVVVDRLPVEYVLTTDARLRSRLPQEQTPFWFRQPYAIVVLVSCEDLDEYKNVLKPRLRLITQNEEREWFIVFVSKAQLANDQAGKLTRKIYGKLEVDFSNKKRERCCKLDMHVADAAFWEDLESKIVECIRITLDRRVQFYEEEIRNLCENRFSLSWNFCSFFILKESLALMFEMAQLHDDALREYDELEQCYTELVNSPLMKQKDFGGRTPGDDAGALLHPNQKPLSQIMEEDTVREFDFRQYLFGRQAQLLFHLGRPVEVAARGYSFVILFSKVLSDNEKNLPFCLREVWAITACLALVKQTTERFNPRSVTPEVEKEFFRLQGDLYSLARAKLMRLGDLIGYGKIIERSPCNSATLSMLPWPKPAIWPSIPLDAGDQILAKGEVLDERPKPFGISRKPLSLAPTLLLRDANRRRASLSVGNVSELLGSRLSFKDSPAGDITVSSTSPPTPGRNILAEEIVSSPRVTTTARSVSFGPLINNNSGPNLSHIDRPMRLPEIYAAAKMALQNTVTNERLRVALSSIEAFEEIYLELTRAAADNFHRSWHKRHGVVLDGEVASYHYRHGNFDSAAKLYEKVCAMYAGDGWQTLLAEVLPNLAECQKQLDDLAGYLLSCIKLLSLENDLLEKEERITIQSEILRLAYSSLKNPVSVDVSLLIKFSGRGGLPLKLCEGDPGSLSISVWSGFPEEIMLDVLSVTLNPTFTAEEGVKVVKSAQSPSLKPGRNNVQMLLPPQRPGSYVLGVLTGQLGQVRLRSHTFCTTSAVSSKGGSPENDDFLSLERPLRPVLQVLEPRPLVEISCVVSWGLLKGESQWLGLIIRPIDYSLKGSILHLSSGSGLILEDPQVCELEDLGVLFKAGGAKQTRSGSMETLASAGVLLSQNLVENGIDSKGKQDKQLLNLREGKIALPDWISNHGSVLWLRVKAVQDKLEQNICSSAPQSPSSPSSPHKSGTLRINGIHLENSYLHEKLAGCVENGKRVHVQSRDAQSIGVMKLNLRLEYGAGLSRIYERTVTVQFLEPLRTVTRIVAKGNGNTILLQVTLVSELNAVITILDAQLDLQPGFSHNAGANGRPYPSSILPLVMAPSSESALLFTVNLETNFENNGTTSGKPASNAGSTLTICYQIVGDRTLGAHSPNNCLGSSRATAEEPLLVYRSLLVLQMPTLDPLLAVGMLSFPCSNPCVGEKLIIQWRIERLKEGSTRVRNVDSENEDKEELLYEIDADTDNWMLAGRKKGHLKLPFHVGARVVISMACVPVVAGYVRPPMLGLPQIDKTRISCTPAGPHVICVLPPLISSSFCIKKQ